jgi:hypothetical protein
MKDLRTVLREGDPAAADQGLTPDQTTRMRRAIVIAARRPDVVRTPWQQPLAVAAMVVLTVAAGVFAGQRLARSQPEGVDQPRATPIEERRQLQFSTPGGTRIIWVFDPEFSVKETVP